MRHLERYTPEICSQLRQMAERRQWIDWQQRDGSHQELLEDLKLTYHLHIAAEASGARAGMPPMPAFPAGFVDSEGILDPVYLFQVCTSQHNARRRWNYSDSRRNSPALKKRSAREQSSRRDHTVFQR